jgi:hypothetical protein
VAIQSLKKPVESTMTLKTLSRNPYKEKVTQEKWEMTDDIKETFQN